MIHRLSEDFLNKTIKGTNYEMRFKYNTQHDYFYFDLFDLRGNEVWLNNRVVNGVYNDDISFRSQYDYANINNVSSFSLEII